MTVPRRRVVQAIPLHRLNDAPATWPTDWVSLAGVVVTIAGLYVLGVWFEGMWR
jgi:hypothetical protein